MNYCSKCGEPIEPGGSVCPKCGKQTLRPAGVEGPQVSQPPVVPPPPPSKTSGSFFSSRGGKVLTILVALLIVAGVVTAAVLLATEGGGKSGSAVSLADSWSSFDSAVTKVDGKVSTVKDLAAAVKSGDIEEFRKNIKACAEECASISKNLDGVTPSKSDKAGYDALVETIRKFGDYLDSLDGFYAKYMKNQKDQDLDLALMQAKSILVRVKSDAAKFLKESKQVKDTAFEPDIFDLPSAYLSQVSPVGENVTEADRTTDKPTNQSPTSSTATTDGQKDQTPSTTTTDTGGARSALTDFLDGFVSDGWFSLRDKMTEDCYRNTTPPGYTEYTVTGYEVVGGDAMADTASYTVTLNYEYDNGTGGQHDFDFKLVNSGGSWLVSEVRG